MAWAPDYVTVAEARDYITRVDVEVDDVQIALAVTAASRAVDKHTNRQFGLVAAAEERLYTARYDKRRCRWTVPIDDLMTTDNLVITTDAGTVDEYRLWQANAAQVGRPWTALIVHPDSAVKPTAEEDAVTIDAEWGWSSVPTTIEQATLLQASRLFSRRGAPFGIAGSPTEGSEMRLLARVDPDVAVTLGPYVRWWAAA